MGIKTAIERRWYSRSPGFLYLLYPLELLFKYIAARRKLKLSDAIVASSNTPPVVVVGNIVVGGTGKTPIIIALTRLLNKHNLKVGIISRGYGRKCASLHIVSISSSTYDSGDEPLEIFHATQSPVIVSSDRHEAIRVLDTKYDVDVILSDDGLQHYSLHRDIEISVFNQFQGLGNQHCLPLGPLREPASRLHNVDYIFINTSKDEHPSLDQIRQHRSFDFHIQPVTWTNVVTGETKDLTSFHHLLPEHIKTLAIAGIGQPKKFFDLLTSIGVKYKMVEKPDHAEYSKRDFDTSSYDIFLMTAKDAVKCKDIAPPNSWYLTIEAVLPEKLEVQFITQIQDLLSNKA